MSKSYKKPPMVRILPMDRTYEFDNWEIKRVQEDYFLQTLPDDRNGKYLYKKRGMDAPTGTVVLFQYDNYIVASARYLKSKDFSQPVNNEYYGAYYFEPNSITVFNPVSRNEVKQIWGNGFVDSEGEIRAGFERFSHTKTFLDPSQYPVFLKLLKNKQPTFFKRSSPKIGRKYGSGGEGQDHKELKIWLSQNPHKLGLKNVVNVEIEYKFLSGDAADIIFVHSKNRYTIIEVETNIPMPGAHQAIKYRALLCAEKQFPLDSPKVRAILVAWSIPKDVRIFCRNYSIGYQVHKK